MRCGSVEFSPGLSHLQGVVFSPFLFFFLLFQLAFATLCSDLGSSRSAKKSKSGVMCLEPQYFHFIFQF